MNKTKGCLIANFATVPFIKYHCSKDEINDLSKMIERWL
ncbi:Resolvase/integrase Bin [Klebsiella pneumoniae IS46]|nr:Resolvase/integrase Bin [Klebsiella pneumoniae IS46]